MTTVKDQRILVLCNQTENIDASSITAVCFSLFLNKEVCFFGSYNSDKEKQKLEALTSNLVSTVQKNMPGASVSSLLLKGKLAHLMDVLVAEYNAVLLCCSGKMDRKIMPAFYNSTIPFLFAKNGASVERKFKQVVIPLDIRNCTKESAVWGSYLGRFNQSEIVFFKASEHNREFRSKVDEIETAVTKFYNQFSFKFSVQNGESSSWGIHLEALEKSQTADLLIATGSLNVSLIDRIRGPFEKQLVNRSKETPILLINPQQDQCSLCE